VLPAEISADPDYRARFNREADLASKLWHPHIVSVHDRGEYDGQLWISMDYVDGVDAARLLSSRYPKGMSLPDLSLIDEDFIDKFRPQRPPKSANRDAQASANWRDQVGREAKPCGRTAQQMDDAIGGRLGVKASGSIRTAPRTPAMIPGATRLGLSGTRMVLDGLG
jgi:hypothetical protein